MNLKKVMAIKMIKKKKEVKSKKKLKKYQKIILNSIPQMMQISIRLQND